MTDRWLDALEEPGEGADLLAAFVGAARARRRQEDEDDLAEGEIRDGYHHDEALARALATDDASAIRLAAASAPRLDRPRARYAAGPWALAWVPDGESYAVCLAGPGPAILRVGAQALPLSPGRWTPVVEAPPEAAALEVAGAMLPLPRRES